MDSRFHIFIRSFSCPVCIKSFRSLPQKPLSVDLTVEEGQRLKVIYGSVSGFHAIDVDSGTPYDLYLPTHVSTRSALDGVLAGQA